MPCSTPSTPPSYHYAIKGGVIERGLEQEPCLSVAWSTQDIPPLYMVGRVRLFAG